MRCPVCDSKLQITVNESDQIDLRLTGTNIIFECFLDYTINTPENRFWDARYSKIIHTEENKYRFKVFTGQQGDELFYVEGLAEFYFIPDDIPEIKFNVLEEKDVTVKLSDVDSYLNQD